MKATYALGTAPELTVWTDELLDVQFTAPLAGPVQFALEAPATAGPLALDASTGRLTFRPAAGDTMPFAVTVVARSPAGGAPATQNITVTPKPRARPALVALQHASPLPDPASAAYLHVTETEGAEETFNGARAKLITVEICGVRVILEPNSDSYPLFRRFSGRPNVKRLRIDADEIVVRGPFRLPGTEVTFCARSLAFEDRGDQIASLDTTPLPITQPSGADEGQRGQDAGSVTLLTEWLMAPGPAIRVRADGGAGQPARPGQPGEPGRSLNVWDGTASTRTYWSGHETLNWARLNPVRDGYQPIRADIWSYYEPGAVHKYLLEGTLGDPQYWQGDGSPPRVYPGRPGHGGNGGAVRLRAPSLLSNRFSVAAGAAGAKADPIAPARAGTPVKSSFVKATYQQWIVPPLTRSAGDGTLNIILSLTVEATHESKDGPPGPQLDVNPATPPAAPGRVHNIIEQPWLQPRGVRAVLAYVRDVFLANRTHDIRQLIQEYRDALTPLAGAEVTLASLEAEFRSLVEALEGPLDYFAHPAGWVPMLSFEANLRRYESEVDASIRAMFFSAWVERRQAEKAAAAGAIETALGLLEAEAKAALVSLDAAQKKLDEVTRRYDQIGTDAKRIRQSLKDRERDIKRLAKDDLQLEHILRASGKILSGALQLIPVGQPALGLAGKGIGIFAEMDFDKPLDSASDFAGLGAEIAQKAVAPKVKTLLSSLTDTETSASTPTDPKQKKFDEALAKKELEEKVKGHMAEEKEAKSAVKSALSSFSVPEEEIDAEFARISATCPQYQALVGQAADLSKRQKHAAVDLNAVLSAIDDAVTTVLNARMGRIALGANLGRSLAGLDIEARQAASGLGQRARDRLVKYQYLLVKAYHYLMVSDAEGVDYSAVRLFDAFSAMLGDSPDGTLSADKLATLRIVFEDQLRTVTGAILDWYQSHQPRETGTFLVTLTPEQLKVLNGESREVDLDLFSMGYLDPDIEDVRISEIKTEAVDVLEAPPAGAANLSLTYTHGGEGVVRRGGVLYVFRTGDSMRSDLDDRRFWRTDVSLRDGKQTTLTQSAPNPVEASLIAHLLTQDKHTNQPVLRGFQPPAWAKITVRRSATPFTFAGGVASLTLRVHHVFHRVAAHIATVIVRAPGAPDPCIEIDVPDLSGAAGGRAMLLRSYDRRGTRQIALSAPRTAGGLVFLGWRILHRAPEQPNTQMMPLMAPDAARAVGDARDLIPGPTLTLDLASDAVVDALYVRPAAP